MPSRPAFFIPSENHRQVKPQQQQLLLAPSVSSSTGRKRKLQKEDVADIAHHQVTSPRKVYTNKRRRLSQQQQSNGDINTSISSENCTKRQIPSSAISVDIQKTIAGASPKERRVDNNISNDVVCIAGPIKAATASVLLNPRLVIQQQSKDNGTLRPGSDAAATASKKNNSRGETSSDEERFLGAFEKKLTYSKAELGRETKLSAGRINHLIVKYCDKVSPESSQSKVYLKPEFRVGNTQHPVVWFNTPIPATATVVFVHQLPATFILPPMSLDSFFELEAENNNENTRNFVYNFLG